MVAKTSMSLFQGQLDKPLPQKYQTAYYKYTKPLYNAKK